MNISGLGTNLSLQIIDKTRDKQLDAMANSPQHKRAIDYFKENIGSVVTVDDLLDDYQLYSFTMKAFGLEDQMFGKAMMKKVFESDIEDRGALVNRLNNGMFKEIYKSFDFKYEGTMNYTTYKTEWKKEIVDKYLDTQFENKKMDESESVGIALYAERKASTMKSWYHVLADKDMASFMRTALGIPDSMAQVPIDKQKKLFEEKFDIEKLQDPEEVDKLQVKYGAMYDALNGGANSPASPLVSLFNPINTSGSFVPATIDITSITALNSLGRYSV